MKMFMVGGAVRDEILGHKTSDIDFTVELEDQDFGSRNSSSRYMGDPFVLMVAKLKHQGFQVFATTPHFFVAKAKFPKTTEFAHYGGLVADFVLARKESTYTDGRRPDVVEVGTLHDDLARRDFTMNAIAKDTDGALIDPFNGREDIDRRVIRAVGDPLVRLQEDALRAVRALRFSVTKGFTIQWELAHAMEVLSVLDAIKDNISDERIMAELSKMLRFDTLKSLEALNKFPQLTRAMFDGKVNLDATMKTKNRG
jgi:tRNA nucleotidyltransferase (CCA-adding enzyme)